MPRVEVTIDKEGNVQVEAHGVKGQGCQALTKAFERAIGQTVDDRKKPEFAQGQPTSQSEPAKAGQ